MGTNKTNKTTKSAGALMANRPPTSTPNPSSAPSINPLSPHQAMHIARQAKRSRPQPQPDLTDLREPPPIPSLPPAPHSPARVAPVLLVLSQMLIDMLAVAAAFGLAYWLRFESDIFPRYAEPDVLTYAVMLAVTLGTTLLTFYFSKLYNLKRGASRVDEFYKIAAAVSIGTVLSLALNSLILGEGFVYSRQILLTGWILSIIFVTIGRLLYNIVVGQLRKRGLDRAKVLVLGSGPTAAVVVDRLRRHDTLGYEVVGVVDDTHLDHLALPTGGTVPVLGARSSLPQLIRKKQIDEVVVALSGASDTELRSVIDLLQDETVSIKIYPDAFKLMTQNEVSVAELSGLPLITVKDVALRGWNRRLKRAFDILFSLAVLILTAPLMLLIAAAIKLTSPGPVFFIQTRVGLDGKPFRLVKFRTMRVDLNGNEVPRLKEGMPGWTVPNDPRRTRLGALLRRFSLDELPQFYNVLIGEMSVVGPRPEQPEYVQEFARRWGTTYLRRHREKAGITGWAQVNGLRGDSSIEERTAADLYYVENWSLLFDLKIIVRTIWAMIAGKNAY